MAKITTVEAPGKKCRFRVCKFIDKLNDAQFGSIYDYVQCKGCEL